MSPGIVLAMLIVAIGAQLTRLLAPGRGNYLVAVVCAALGADSWATLASGCLLAAFPQPVADVAVARLAERFDATVLGRVETGRGVYDETGSEIAWPNETKWCGSSRTSTTTSTRTPTSPPRAPPNTLPRVSPP